MSMSKFRLLELKVNVSAPHWRLFLGFWLRVPCVSASAFVRLTPGLIRYRYAGAAERGGPRTVFAKCSHPSVAERFSAPASARMLGKLVQDGGISAADAELAAPARARWPLSENVL